MRTFPNSSGIHIICLGNFLLLLVFLNDHLDLLLDLCGFASDGQFVLQASSLASPVLAVPLQKGDAEVHFYRLSLESELTQLTSARSSCWGECESDGLGVNLYEMLQNKKTERT